MCVHMCANEHVFGYICLYMKRPGVDIGCLSQSLPTSFIEARSLSLNSELASYGLLVSRCQGTSFSYLLPKYLI